jgi:hypothetical protein
MKSVINAPAKRDVVTDLALASASNASLISSSTLAPITAMTDLLIWPALKVDSHRVLAAPEFNGSFLL